MNRRPTCLAGLVIAACVILAGSVVARTFVDSPGAAPAPASVSLNTSPSALSSVVSSDLAIALAGDAAAMAGDPLDAKIIGLQQQVRATGAKPVTLERLGWAFVEKARVSGDHGYYLLAESCARAMEQIAPDSPEGALLEGHVLQSLHRFADAEKIAVRLIASRGIALDFALYGDVLLDQGRIDEAVDAYQRMMRRRPDSRAFSRVAEVRLLTGDLEGAREALRTAARAVSARDGEAFAWIWARLAMVELQSGHLEEARAIVESAVATTPGSPVAELARGRVLLASGDSEHAVAALERSVVHSPLPDALRALADAYAGAGRQEDAARTISRLEALGPSVDPRGFSLWLAETGRDAPGALALAEEELRRRRDIYTFAALALAEAAAGRVSEARGHMTEALAAGTQDPRLWYHAGLVAEAARQPAEARQWFLKADSQSQMLIPSLRRALAQRLQATAVSEG